jgi:lipopolysaccharide export system protein LptC
MNRVITARPDPHTARSYWTMSRGDSERAFRAARRHSRLVRILRVAIPVAVVAGLTGVSLVTYFNPLRMLKKLPIDVSDLVISGSKVTMEQPRLSGFTSDSRAYELSAEAAAQDLTKPNIVELRKLHAKIELKDKTMVEMSAVSGLYDTKGDTIKLEHDIQLNSSSGYKGRLREALVDIGKGHVVSNQPVDLDFLQGTLNANRLEIVDSGDLVRFDGGVNMVLMLDGTSPLKQPPGPR